MNVMNFVSTGIFIIVVASLLYLIKRHVMKFISFYIMRKDYIRMKCVQVQSHHN